MKEFLMVILGISSIILIASILMQSGNSAGLSGSIGGGAEQLFGKKKANIYETILKRVTEVAAVCFIVISVALVAINK